MAASRHIPQIDRTAFSARLKAAMKTRPDLFPSDWGRNKALAERYGVRPSSANSWLSGKNMPDPEKALAMADDMNQPFMEFYFGNIAAIKRNQSSDKASQPLGISSEILATTIDALDQYYRLTEGYIPARHDPEEIEALYPLIAQGPGREGSEAPIVVFADWRRRRVENGLDKGSSTGTSNAAGLSQKGQGKATSSKRR